MSDFVIVEGDQVVFLPTFGAALVIPQPANMQASGPAKIGGKKMCVEGDEGNVTVSGVTYFTPAYPIPGTGTLSIDSLAGDQVAKKSSTGGKSVLLKGSQFNAKFEVQSPAQQPPPSGTPDSTTQYSGNGMFVPSNVFVKAT